MHQNIAGLLSKSDAISVCLEELESEGTFVDVVCFTEHFIMKGYENYLTIPNYELAAYYSRDNSKRGGACIIVRKGLQFKELKQINKMSETGVFECCAIEIINYKIAVVCLYRVPKDTNFNLCMEKLDILLQELNNKSFKHIVIAGDFNINILKNTYQTRDFECLLLNYNLKLSVHQPTRLKSQTCIDNIAHNVNKSCKAQVLELALSDHTAQLIKIPVQKHCTIKYWRTRRRDYDKEYINKFKNYLRCLTFSDIYETNDSNLAFNSFMETFTLFYNLCFPMKIVTTYTTKKANWISRGVKICSKKKRHLLWQYRRNPNASNKIIFTKYSKLFKKIMQLTQKAQNNHKINTSSNKCKTSWKIINNSKHVVPRQNITKIKFNNKIITSPQKIANVFNNYFIEKVIPIQGSGNKASSQINNSEKSFFMPPCIPQDVLQIIRSLNNTNSVGHDGISTNIIKSVSSEICVHLSHLINLSISTGTFPDALKISIVKPLFKKDDEEAVECYRPISLVSIISKIYEKYIYKEISKYIEKNNILVNEQKGFREKHTINMAIYDFLYKVITNVDRSNPVCTIFCDMTQAFDHVRHDILLDKLYSYGIRGNVLQLIKSYLSERKQITEISSINIKNKFEEASQSEPRIVKYGVPQGSVLGPLLFIIYINDLPKSIDQPVTLFADDSTVTIQCNNKGTYGNDINNSLSTIINWLNNNNLKINLNKTNAMHFKQRTRSDNNPKVVYNNKTIEEVTTTKFLGITIDAKLNWKDQVEILSKKICSSAYALYKLAPLINIKSLLLAYHGLVSSHLRYGIIFWGNSTDRGAPFKAQKRCVRSMFRLKPTDSCKPYFVKYKILTMPSLYILEVAMFVKQNKHLFLSFKELSSRSRRDNTVLCSQSANTALMRKSIFCMAPIIYNKLPKSWKEENSKIFKKRLQKFLEKKAYYNISEFLNDKVIA